MHDFETILRFSKMKKIGSNCSSCMGYDFQQVCIGRPAFLVKGYLKNNS